MYHKNTVGFDVDGVLCNLISPWLAQYNRDYSDNLTVTEVSDWDISKFVKPECGKKIFDYLEDPSLYDNAFPYAGMLEVVKFIRKLYNVKFITTATVGSQGRKLIWLQEHGFFRSGDEYAEMKDKSNAPVDILIDDYIENVKGFYERGSGVSLLVRREWNYSIPFIFSAHTPREIREFCVKWFYILGAR